MAQRIQVLLTDDLDGTEATETLTFAFEGTSFEIDLNDKNAAKFRKFIDPYIKAARRPKPESKGRGRRLAQAPSSSSNTAEIREWARKNGYEVSNRGRVPATIREAYEKAQG